MIFIYISILLVLNFEFCVAQTTTTTVAPTTVVGATSTTLEATTITSTTSVLSPTTSSLEPTTTTSATTTFSPTTTTTTTTATTTTTTTTTTTKATTTTAPPTPSPAPTPSVGCLQTGFVDVLLCVSSSAKTEYVDVVSKLNSAYNMYNITYRDCHASQVEDETFLKSFDVVFYYVSGGRTFTPEAANAYSRYVDQGGRVVVAPFAFAGAGAIIGEFANYLPMTTGSQMNAPSGQHFLDTFTASHPLMTGVSSFKNNPSGPRSFGSVQGNADVVAYWNDGTPLVLTRPNGVTVTNFFPVSSDVQLGYWSSTTDGAVIMSNALRFIYDCRSLSTTSTSATTSSATTASSTSSTAAPTTSSVLSTTPTATATTGTLGTMTQTAGPTTSIDTSATLTSSSAVTASTLDSSTTGATSSSGTSVDSTGVTTVSTVDASTGSTSSPATTTTTTPTTTAAVATTPAATNTISSSSSSDVVSSQSLTTSPLSTTSTPAAVGTTTTSTTPATAPSLATSTTVSTTASTSTNTVAIATTTAMLSGSNNDANTGDNVQPGDSVSEGGLPGYAIALIIIGTLLCCAALIGVAVVLFVRRQRAQKGKDTYCEFQ